MRESGTGAFDIMAFIDAAFANHASSSIGWDITIACAAFITWMLHEAKRIGMNDSHFVNATGLPSVDHYTTAWDLALLTRTLIRDYPKHYAIYAEKSFNFNNIDQPNRNRLLWRDRTVDGVKTGHTEEAGYCLVASAKRDDMRLISVVMGTESDEARMRESQKLLSYGFRYFETHKLYDAGVPLKTARIWYGQEKELALGTREPVTNYHHIAERTNPELRKAFFNKCIENGLYFHTDFTISAQHDENLLNNALDILKAVTREVKATI